MPQHRHITYATKPGQQVVLELVINTRGDEIQILEYLHRTSAPENHTIPFTSVLHTRDGTIIAMPRLKPFSECDSFSVPVRTTFVLARHLLEAACVMHTNGVVHRDLKPENVVVGDDKSQLFVIDYDLAERVDGRDDVVSGYVGTDGFMAPEIRMCKEKDRLYYAIPADLWATGNLPEHLLLIKCDEPESPALETLWSISSLLKNNDPEEQPSADEALTMLDTPSGDTALESPRIAADGLEGPRAASMEWSSHPISLAAP
jgi:serine/threonine protein kinase